MVHNQRDIPHNQSICWLIIQSTVETPHQKSIKNERLILCTQDINEYEGTLKRKYLKFKPYRISNAAV